MAFVTVYHRDIDMPWPLPSVPEELLDHYAEAGWERVPEDLNLLDRDAVEDFLADPPELPKPKTRARKPKET